MKIRLAFCLVSLACSTVAIAGPDSEKIAGELLDASGVRTAMEESFMGAIKPAFDQVKMGGGSEAMVNDMIAVARKFYADNYKWETIRPVMAKTYAAELSDDDMKAMTAFYQTPAGKVAASKLNQLTRKGNEEVTASLQSKIPELRAAMVEVAQKHAGEGKAK